MFLPGDDNTREIQQLITESDGLDSAVAFIGKKAETLFSNVNSKCRIICNLKSGGTNPEVVKQLLDLQNIDIRDNPLLHAKVYIGKNVAIISSANLSANRLGLEADELNGWLEAGYKITDHQELKGINSWFLDIWKRSKKITPNDIEMAMKTWNKRQIVRPTIGSNISLFKVLRDSPEVLQNRNLYMTISTDSMSDSAIDTLNYVKEESKYGCNVEAFESWPELPENSYFIDFYVGPRGGFNYYGIFKSPEKKILISFMNDDNEDENLFLCYEQKNCFGYILTKEDKSLLKSKGAELLKSNIGIGDVDGKYISILDARSILFNE